MHPLLAIDSLKTWFELDSGTVKAVDGVDLTVNAGETLALVGESGSGKSVLSLSVMGLVPPPGRVRAGAIRFQGSDLLSLSAAEMRRVRGNRVAMVFQDPMTSLNPVMRVGYQIAESVRLHTGVNKSEASLRAVELLELVGIPDASSRARAYPHELSGGMRQRVMIAIAIACEPALLIADEPTTALDVTIQAQILELLRDLQERTGMGMLFVTHDLGVVAEFADRVAVMYAGRLVEEATVQTLFDSPRMPYSAGLMASVPRLDVAQPELYSIEGSVPSAHERPSGCAFHPRCTHAEAPCRSTAPEFEVVGPQHGVRCHRWRELQLTAEGAA